MKLFFYRYTVEILNVKKVKHIGNFDTLIKGEAKLKKLKGQVLWLLPSREDISALLHAATIGSLCELQYISLAVEDVDTTFELIKSQFRIVKAGGGIVEKEHQLLLIYRYSCWDLPKGKRKSGEDIKKTAQREVEEECNIRVQCGRKIGVTYHIIPLRKEKYGFKKTTWYHMKLIDDSHMHPQQEEGIEKVAWFDLQEALKLTKHSYASIRHIMYMYQLQLAQNM